MCVLSKNIVFELY